MQPEVRPKQGAELWAWPTRGRGQWREGESWEEGG